MTISEAYEYFNADEEDKIKTDGYVRIFNVFKKMAMEYYGEDVWDKDLHRRRIFKLRERYSFDEIPITIPSITREFSSYSDIKDCAFGISKLALRSKKISNFKSFIISSNQKMH